MFPAIKEKAPCCLFVPEAIPGDLNDIQENCQHNFARLYAGDCEAVRRGILTGRYFREIVEDGYAYYVVVEEIDGGRVRIRLVHGVSTDTPAACHGEEAVILRGLALSRIQHRYR